MPTNWCGRTSGWRSGPGKSLFGGSPRCSSIEMAKGAVSSLITRRGTWRVGQVLNGVGRGEPKWPNGGHERAPHTAADPGLRRQSTRRPRHRPLTGVPIRSTGSPSGAGVKRAGCCCSASTITSLSPGLAPTRTLSTAVNDSAYPADVARLYAPWWSLPATEFMNGWCCVYGTTTDGYPIVARDIAVANLYHALGMNGHGITIHALPPRGVAS